MKNNIFRIVRENDWNQQFLLEEKLLKCHNKMLIFPKRFRITPKTVLKLIEQGNEILESAFNDTDGVYVLEKEWKPVTMSLQLFPDSKRLSGSWHEGYKFDYFSNDVKTKFPYIAGINVAV